MYVKGIGFSLAKPKRNIISKQILYYETCNTFKMYIYKIYKLFYLLLTIFVMCTLLMFFKIKNGDFHFHFLGAFDSILIFGYFSILGTFLKLRNFRYFRYFTC